MTTHDLSLLIKETTKIKFSDDITFEIPKEPSVFITNQLMILEPQMGVFKKEEDNKGAFDALVDLVTSILKLDKSKDIDRNYIIENLHVSQMEAVAQIYMDQAAKNKNNPN